MDAQISAFKYLSHIMSNQDSYRTKVLLSDPQTIDILSVSITKTELLSFKVLLLEELSKRLSRTNDESDASLSCLIIIKPEERYVDMIVQELKNPHYNQYLIYFTNSSTEAQIKRLATADVKSLVVHVEDVFLEFYPLNRRLFSLEIPNVKRTIKESPFADTQGKLTNGLFSFICSQNVNPYIRYDRTSGLCSQVARRLDNMIRDEKTKIYNFDGISETATVLILDRTIDPVVPLLHLWNYSTALHDIFGINKNIVSVDNEKYVLNQRGDPESSEYYTSFLGALSEVVSKRLDDIINKSNKLSQHSSNYGDLIGAAVSSADIEQEKRLAKTHLTLLTSIKEAVSEELVELSFLEQDIAMSGNSNDMSQRLISTLKNSVKISKMDALRAALVSILKSRGNNIDQYIRELQYILEEKFKCTNLETRYLVKILDSVRRSEYFNTNETSSQSLFKKTLDIFKKGNSGDDIFQDYKCLLQTIISQWRDDKLDLNLFPFVSKSDSSRKLIIFFVDGTTYEEMRAAQLLSTNGFEIVVGGSCVHNAESFLDKVIGPDC